MSYTPTTEEVREIYRGCLVQTETNIYSFVDEAQADAEFDRWLGVVKAEAVAEWLAERMAAFEKATLEDYEQGETE